MGALIGGGVTFLTTGRQVASQEQAARIARREAVYGAYYTAVVTFGDAAHAAQSRTSIEEELISKSSKTTILKQADTLFRKSAPITAHSPSLAFVGSPNVNLAARDLEATIFEASTVPIMIGNRSLIKGVKVDTTRVLSNFDNAREKLLETMRADLNVSR